MMIDHEIERFNFKFSLSFAQVDDEDGKAAGFVFQFVVGRRAREQEHEIGLQHA